MSEMRSRFAADILQGTPHAEMHQDAAGSSADGSIELF
jgi:hypothetical protein